jgi:flagellin-like protein
MRRKRANNAVSEIVGTSILLAMAIALFSIVQIMAVSFPFNPHPPSARLVGYVDGEWVFIPHHGGEPLDSDTRIIIIVDGISNESNIETVEPLSNNSDKDSLWEIGEILGFKNTSHLSGLNVKVIIADTLSNEIIMMSTLKE